MYKQRDEEEGELPFFKALKVLAFGCALFSAVLLIDFVIPAQCSTETILKRVFEKESDRFGGEVHILHVVTNERTILAIPAMFEDAQENASIEVCVSPLLRNAKQVSGINLKNGKAFEHECLPPIYKGYCAFPISLLLLSLFTLFFKGDDTVSYGAGIISLVLVVSILIIL